MRIGVLEWICGGGARLAPTATFPDSIQAEGWAMCRAALADIVLSGHTAVSIAEPSLLQDPQLETMRGPLLDVCGIDDTQPVTETWKKVYGACDAVLVIAPESDGLLEQALEIMAQSGIRTLNANGEFLKAAGDKWLTAEALHRNKIPHPRTALLSELTEEWLGRAGKQTTTWILKPRDGVGCDGILKVSQAELWQRREAIDRPERWIVQPLLRGEACSRAAILRAGQPAVWLPIATQRITGDQSMHYDGGRIEAHMIQNRLIVRRKAKDGCANLPELARKLETKLTTFLDRTLDSLGSGAAGWVGVDFLMDLSDTERPFTIIEVNPRLTSSFVGLSAACGGGLIAAMVEPTPASDLIGGTRWRSVEFDARGNVRVV